MLSNLIKLVNQMYEIRYQINKEWYKMNDIKIITCDECGEQIEDPDGVEEPTRIMCSHPYCPYRGLKEDDFYKPLNFNDD